MDVGTGPSGDFPVTVIVTDSGGLSENQNFVVTVATPPNGAPVAQDEPFTTAGTVLQQPAPGVLANDSDPDGDIIIALLVSGPANGTVNLNPDGSFTYTPNAGFVGTDSFTYKASDGKLDSNLATVTITVTEANQPPVITSTPNIAKWFQSHPSGKPPTPRAFASPNAYDVSNDRLIVFGGSENLAALPHLNEVWVLENATERNGASKWLRLNPQGNQPTGRVYHSPSYDPTSNRLIVHGGAAGNSSPILSDTWVLTNANGLGGEPQWMSLPSSSGTSAGHVSGYDPVTNRLIVFGGFSSGKGSDLNSVRILKDANGMGVPEWITLSTSGNPPPPRGEIAAGEYDPISNSLIIFGGSTTQGQYFNDVWVLTNANGTGGSAVWQQLSSIGETPTARVGHSVSYDQNSRKLIVFGGNTSAGNVNETWVLSNANGQTGTPRWMQLPTAGTKPLPRSVASVGYNPTDNRLLLFGGRNDPVDPGLFNNTWILTNASGNCTANQPCDYDVEASDADAGDVLSYALVQGPAGMTIEAGTGQLHWTPGVAQTGTHDVSVKVTDAGGLSATQSFQLTVAPVAVPNVQGLAPEWAEAMLQAAGLNTGAKSSLGGAITLNFDTLPSEQGWTYFAMEIRYQKPTYVLSMDGATARTGFELVPDKGIICHVYVEGC